MLQLIGAHERSDESDSDSGGEDLDEPDSVPRPDGLGTARRQQSIDLADPLLD